MFLLDNDSSPGVEPGTTYSPHFVTAGITITGRSEDIGRIFPVK